MKINRPWYPFVLWMLAIWLVFLGCRKKPAPSLGSLAWSRFKPERALPATTIRLIGSHFGNDPEAIQVHFSDKRATISKLIADTIHLVVPSDLSPGYYKVLLQRGEEGISVPQPFVVTRPEPRLSLSAIPLGSLTAQQVKGVIEQVSASPGLEGLRRIISLLKYGVDFHRITYMTTYRQMQASAVVALPLPSPGEAMRFPVLAFCHGTITKKSDAPSEVADRFLPFSSEVLANEDPTALFSFLYGLSASLGYICVLPDYLGFGVSADQRHPYYVSEALGGDVVASVFGARTLAKNRGTTLDSALYLTGYSEGGYVAVAAQQRLDATPVEEIILRLTLSGAGGYDMGGMMDYLRMQQTYPEPAFLPYVLLAYEEAYGSGQIRLADYIKSPYLERLTNLYMGTLDLSEISNQLTTNLSELLVGDFLNRSGDQTRYAPLTQALQENSLLDWTPYTRLILYHGGNDELIPYSNTERTFQALEQRAEEGLLELQRLEGGHRTAIVPFVEAALARLLVDRAFAQGRPEEANRIRFILGPTP